jgi:hypothetical protein
MYLPLQLDNTLMFDGEFCGLLGHGESSPALLSGSEFFEFAFFSVAETALVYVEQEFNGNQRYIFLNQSNVPVQILMGNFESQVLLRSNG